MRECKIITFDLFDEQATALSALRSSSIRAGQERAKALEESIHKADKCEPFVKDEVLVDIYHVKSTPYLSGLRNSLFVICCSFNPLSFLSGCLPMYC